MSAPQAIEKSPVPGEWFEDEFIDSINPADLVYFLLNVGDGDAQLVLLPERDGHRDVIVVDIASYSKICSLLSALQGADLIPAGDDLLITLVVATHPHKDHIGGMSKLLRNYHVEELWEPGYFLPTRAFLEMSSAAEDGRVTVVLPTSGLQRRFGPLVQLTVLAPSVAFRSRFDTYGVTINDSSLTLMIEYPSVKVAQGYRERTELKGTRGQRILLGADAQTASWAQVEIDFPALHSGNSWLAGQIRHRRGADHLKADVFKIPHHASKRGINLELVERVAPKLSLVSCAADSPSYHFPHDLAQEILREARQPTAGQGTTRRTDHQLGIYYTSDVYIDDDESQKPLGSIAIVLGEDRRDRQLWRLCDSPTAPINFSGAARLF